MPIYAISHPIPVQKAALERKLDELGYEAVMREGTDLIRALAEASPVEYSSTSDKEKAEYMEQIYARSIFGCMEKHSQPIANLLAAAKKAGTMAAGEFDTMIVPSGLQELLQWTRAENVYYYLNGTATSNKEKIQFGLDGGRVDPSSGLRVFTTYPKVDYSQGTAYQSAKQGHIMNERTVGVAHFFTGNSPDMFVVDYKTGGMKKISCKGKNDANGTTIGNEDDALKNLPFEDRPVYVRTVKVLMSSAILAKSGSETGEMLMAYPNTAFTNDNTSPEVFKLQLRCYLGAAVYQPNNIMICPDVHFEGVLDSGLDEGEFKYPKVDTIVPFPINDSTKSETHSGRKTTDPLYYFPGATYADAAGQTQLCANSGHFGVLDSPAGAAKMAGLNVFTSDAGGK